MKRFTILAPLVLCCMAVAACSTTPAAKNMTIRDVDRAQQHSGSIGLNVEGGGGLDYRIADAAFEEAVRTSLREAGLFSDVVGANQGDYRLDAILGDCRQPAAGFDMTVVMTVLWSLSARQTTVWQELVESQHTATVGNAFSGAVRMRKATEGAARKNIEEAIRRLSAARLEGGSQPRR